MVIIKSTLKYKVRSKKRSLQLFLKNNLIDRYPKHILSLQSFPFAPAQQIPIFNG